MLPTIQKLLAVAAIFVFTPVCFTACGGGGSNCGDGHDGVPNNIDEDIPPDVFWYARLGVGELNQLTGPDPGHTSLVQAFFRDFTNYRVQDADRLPFSEACFVYTSLQVTTGEPIDLDVTRVTVGGLSGGDLVLEPEGDPPKISTQLIDGRAFAGGPVSFSVESGDGATDFPAFTDELPAPDPVVITRLGDREHPDLSQGPSVNISIDRIDPLEVRWKPGNGDYFEFKIVPGSGTDTKYVKLRCITYDDGCLSVPADALVYLVPDEATNFQLKAERHNSVFHSVMDGDVTKAVVKIDVSSTIEATVLR